VQNVTLDALANDEIPFELLVRELKINRDAGRNPQFQVMLSLEPPVASVGT